MAALEVTKSSVGTATVRLGFSDTQATAIANAAAGLSSAMAAQVVWTPIDVVSQRLMVQGCNSSNSKISKNMIPSWDSCGYRNGIDAFRKILRADGPSGLYRGFGISILTYAPSNAVWWHLTLWHRGLFGVESLAPQIKRTRVLLFLLVFVTSGSPLIMVSPTHGCFSSPLILKFPNDSLMSYGSSDDDGAEMLRYLFVLNLIQEIWNSPYSNDSFPVYAEDIDAGSNASPSTAMLSEVARLLKITIVGGSIPERSGDRLYNTCCVFDTEGKLIAKHRKIHLFDMTFPEDYLYRVEDFNSRADSNHCGHSFINELNTDGSVIILLMSGAHLICYPGAFNMTTGPLHWELLQRARAADNQLYVATCSPARDVGAGYVAWGHSTLVGPFGEVLATTEHDQDIIIAEIDYSLIELRRTSLPLTKQRRGDLYQLVDVQRLNSQS
ncbi:hypothetical protein GH714_029482 [Hevea brasiliensis]|uniref:CN hydrolase domain-containing protein n=1 Tax=Hevea brasiliensis TaxID=3981 RepID=A0A6A6LS50_HEVBR|nr:hypothetical protein GH714_029482 [Hevea brasiliensis]